MPEQQHEQPSDDALREIEQRLNALKQSTRPSPFAKSSSVQNIGRMSWLAFNIVSDLIAGVICGLGIGYGLDRWLGTRPVFIAVFLIMGSIAGMLNAVRFVQQYNKAHDISDETSVEKE